MMNHNQTNGAVRPPRTYQSQRREVLMLRCPNCDRLNETWRILCAWCIEPLNPNDPEMV